METTAKGTLMDCEGCNELLADFLLDELPESEAVLVHEHLLNCPACMKAYRELKGTGKALEAVTTMQPVNGSESFRTEVRSKANEEIEKILAKLPAERRLRLEARREARQSVRTSVRQMKEKPSRVWSPGVLAVALIGAGVLAVLLFWQPPKPTPHTAIGTLSVVMDKVSQFYAKENQAHTPVAAGKSVLPGESFATGEHGRGRIDCPDGSSIFLGPSSELTFRIQPGDSGELSMDLNNAGNSTGEAGFNRGDSTTGGKYVDWQVRTPAGMLTIASATQAYIHLSPNALDVAVLSGCVHAATRDGSHNEPFYAGQRAVVSGVQNSLETLSLTDERPPIWRGELINDDDLARIFGGAGRIVSRHPGQLELELSYTKQAQCRDWVADGTNDAFVERNNLLAPAPPFKARHTAPFGVPLKFELKLDRASRHETSFAFAVLDESPAGLVVADIARENVLTVQRKDKIPRRDSFPRGASGEAGQLVLEIKPDKNGYAAQLSNSSGKTKSLSLWKENADNAAEVWFQALGEGVLIQELKLTGFVPAEWLREHVHAQP